MIALLEGMQYRQVSRMTRPGEFTVQNDSIDILRRPFDFPDGKEGQIRARLLFKMIVWPRFKTWIISVISGYSASIPS